MLTIFVIVFINLVGFGIIIPLLPFYGEHYGASPEKVTALMATYSLFQFLFAPIWGYISDRVGRKPILIISLLGTIIAYLLLAMAPNLIWLFVARAIAGIMAGSISAAFAFMADITTREDRTKGMGIIGSAFGLGFIAGPAIGGFLAGGDINNTNFQVPAYYAAGFAALASIFSVFFLRESLPAIKRQTWQLRFKPIQSLKAINLKLPPDVKYILYLTFFAISVFAALESTFAMWTERNFSWGVEQNGYIFAYSGIISAIIQGFLVGPMAKKWGLKSVINQGFLFLVIGLVLLPFSNTLLLLLVSMAIVTYGFSLTSPALTSQLSLQVSESDQGTVLGLSRSISTLARVIGPLISGYIFVYFGKDWPFFVGGIIILTVLIYGIMYKR